MGKVIWIGVMILAVSSAPAIASAKKSSSATKSMTDQAFVIDAAKGDMAEVELGKVAASKATNEQIRKLAKRMVDDHTKALDDLRAVAKKDSITLPAAVDPNDEAIKDRLDSLSGTPFDRAYMDAIIKDHRQDVVEFRTQSKTAKNADVKGYATKMLPMLEEHLKVAQSTSRAVRGTSSKPDPKKPIA
jgi:putative membrane protein